MKQIWVFVFLFLVALGYSQGNYTSPMLKTYGTAQDERGPIVSSQNGPVVAFERIYSSNDSSAIVLRYDANGTFVWGANLNTTRPGYRHRPVQIFTTTTKIYIMVEREVTALSSLTQIICLRLSDGLKLWSYISANARTPLQMILGNGDLVFSSRSFPNYIRATRIDADTGAFIREDTLTSNGTCRGGKYVPGSALPFCFFGSDNGSAALFRSNTTNFSKTTHPTGIDQSSWYGMSEDGCHLFGQTKDANGVAHSVHAFRPDRNSSTWTTSVLMPSMSDDGFLLAYDIMSQLYLAPTEAGVAYRNTTGTDLIRRFRFDAEGFGTLLPLVNTGITANPKFAYAIQDDLHYMANRTAQPSWLIAVRPGTAPGLQLSKPEEQATSSSYNYLVGTFLAGTGNRDIVIRKIGFPVLPEPVTEWDIEVNLPPNGSALNYGTTLVNVFGNEFPNTLVSGFSHGNISLGASLYYYPDQGFVGTDMATYKFGTPGINGQVRINVGMPHRVLGITFRNLGEVIGGRTLQAKLKLSRAAPAGGLNVPLSTDSTLISVPATVFVEGGADTATFHVSSAKVFATTFRKVVFGPDDDDFAEIKIIPGGLNTFNIGPATVKGGNNATGSISLTGNLPTYMSGATVSVTANGGSVIFPASVTIAPGTINKTFTINTLSVATTTVRTFTATQGVAQKTATLTITP